MAENYSWLKINVENLKCIPQNKQNDKAYISWMPKVCVIFGTCLCTRLSQELSSFQQDFSWKINFIMAFFSESHWIEKKNNIKTLITEKIRFSRRLNK